MAKRGGSNPWVGLGLSVLVAGVVLASLQRGRGDANSLLIPDPVEHHIDRVIAALNGMFGHKWVNYALDILEAHLEQALPGMAAVLSAVHRAERTYGLKAAGAKKK